MVTTPPASVLLRLVIPGSESISVARLHLARPPESASGNTHRHAHMGKGGLDAAAGPAFQAEAAGQNVNACIAAAAAKEDKATRRGLARWR